MLDDDVTAEFTRGVNDYWAGEVPDGWNDPKRRDVTPYLAGWYMASVWESYPGTLLYEDGTPMQEDV